MNGFNSFDDLAADTKRKLLSFNDYSSKYLSRFDGIVNKIRDVLEPYPEVYDRHIVDEWFELFIKENSFGRTTVWRYQRVINLLSDNYDGKLTEYKIYPVVHKASPKSAGFKDLSNKYEEILQADGYADKSISTKMYSVNCFLVFLEKQDIIDIRKISHKDISNYLSSDHFKNRKPAGIATEIIGLKQFIVYLEDKEMVSFQNLHFACLSFPVKSKRIVTTYSESQVDTLLSSDKKLPTSLRNKAVYLLALRCGLRSCDIMNLKFENIDFENKMISIVQKKTGVHLNVPMDNETSNAIIDYILNDRRDSSLPFVFITVSGPVKRLTHNSSFRTETRFDRQNKNDLPPCGGIHILRRTFATSLLKCGADISLISASLGHFNNDTVDYYLSADDTEMRKCGLSLDKFPYSGGLF